MRDTHEYDCEVCGQKCVRVYQKPQVRRNQGFYSWTVGEWVDSHDDFEYKLKKVRYVSGEYDRLGANDKPKDEWVEQRVKKEEKHKQVMKETQAQVDMVSHNARKG
jgi:hypothetical protein